MLTMARGKGTPRPGGHTGKHGGGQEAEGGNMGKSLNCCFFRKEQVRQGKQV